MAQIAGSASVTAETYGPLSRVQADAGFQPVSYGAVPRWELDDHQAALAAFLKSCRRSEVMQAALGPLRAKLESVCARAADLAAQRPDKSISRQFFEQNFVPHAVAGGSRQGLLTGYFEPEVAGSRHATAEFTVPLYRRPPELENLVGEHLRAAAVGNLTHAKRTPAGLIPFETRREIEHGSLAGRDLELVYLADPVDAFFIQIQGSARIIFTDGSSMRIAYDGKNGHPYTSIGRALIDAGVFGADTMTLPALGDWLRADRERGRSTMWLNQSYVFFRDLVGTDADSPVGVHGIPLTPGRSLAVDASVHAIGLPVFVSSADLTHAGDQAGWHRLMIAQDVGSAIRGPQRGDLYFGSGTAAGDLAGITKHPGTFFVLLPR